jgi:hypothetical protein
VARIQGLGYFDGANLEALRRHLGGGECH